MLISVFSLLIKFLNFKHLLLSNFLQFKHFPHPAPFVTYNTI